MVGTGPIALFDSGEGGLTVLRELVKRYPTERFLYAADSGHFPYGEKPLASVRDWFMSFMDFFVSHQARAVIIACNTATAAALPEAQAHYAVPVFGVVDGAVAKAAQLTRVGRVGVLSTQATYQSRLYPNSFRTMDPRITVVAKPCPILVRMAENGQVDGVDVETAVRQCVQPVLAARVDTVILGCTHFPHMREVFNRVVNGRVAIVDPGEEMATHLADRIGLAGDPGAPHPVQTWTTGDPAQFLRVTALLCPGIPVVARPLHWVGSRLIEQAVIP